jgi:hypothetical protein
MTVSKCSNTFLQSLRQSRLEGIKICLEPAQRCRHDNLVERFVLLTITILELYSHGRIRVIRTGMRDKLLYPALEANTRLLGRMGNLLKHLLVSSSHKQILSINAFFHPEEFQALFLDLRANERAPHF